MGRSRQDATDEFKGLSPSKLNDLLTDKYKISLFYFARAICIALLIDENNELKARLWPRGDLKQLEKKLASLKKKIVDTIMEFERVTMASVNKCDDDIKENEKYIAEHYQVKNFFDVINHMQRVAGAHLDLSVIVAPGFMDEVRPSRGSPMNPKTFIAIHWGFVKQRYKLSWKKLANLYDWFWEKLKKYGAYADMAPTDDLISYLKIQFTRYSTRERLDILKPPGEINDIIIFTKHGPTFGPAESWSLLSDNTPKDDFYSTQQAAYKICQEKGIRPLIFFPDSSYVMF
jgi:hypothetical protein